MFTFIIRFIVRHKHRCPVSGAEYENLITVDADVPELQAALDVGGLSENGYHVAEMVGAELRTGENANSALCVKTDSKEAK